MFNVFTHTHLCVHTHTYILWLVLRRISKTRFFKVFLNMKVDTNFSFLWYKILPKTLWLKTINFYYVAISMGQEWESGSAGISCSGSLMRLQSYVGLSCIDLKAWLRLEDLLPRWLNHMTGKFGQGFGRASHVDLSMVAWVFSRYGSQLCSVIPES